VVSQLSFDSRVLYVSAEESGQQVKLRAHRLFAAFESENEGNGESDATLEGEIEESPQLDATEGGFAELLDRQSHSDPEPEPDLESEQTDSNANSHEDNGVEPNFYLLPETDLEIILRELESLKPQLAVIDSIQTIYFASLTSAPGSVAQVRECTSALMQVAKRENITLFIVGHVTKEGSIAGPRVLEHLVDTVLFFEGDRFASHRLLRSMKNRFGATHEIGVFEMVAHGLREVPNPSELFLGSRDEVVSGTSTIVACEGTRPLVVELQALVSPASFGSPRRSSTGVDNNRLQQILAVLEKRVGVPLSKLDTYVASVGGINVQEPAADLGIAIAVVASFRDRIVDPHTVLIGEVGLGGQVRQVSQLEIRLREAAKLGFKRAIVPRSQIPPDLELETIQVTKVLDAILEAIPGSPNMPNVPPQPSASHKRPTLPVVEGELEDEDGDDDWEAETDLF
jgi:DNA repair protein RadA/Sms